MRKIIQDIPWLSGHLRSIKMFAVNIGVLPPEEPMSQFDPEALATQIFSQLRQLGFSLGVGEYLAALDAISGGFGKQPEQLEQTLRLLWCHSLIEQAKFEQIWRSQIKQKTPVLNKLEADRRVEKEVLEPFETTQFSTLVEQSPIALPPPSSKIAEQFAPFPVRVPIRLAEVKDLPDLKAYSPLSCRSMVYNWRYLRRPFPNGPRDVLDIPETVDQTVRQGFFLAPAYRRREQNMAKLLLLVDQNGSMIPFHRFTRDLVETLQTESSLQEEYVSVFYFQNVPQSYVYQDFQLTVPESLEQVLSCCDQDTSVLIVSDAGAARGYRRMDRIRATTHFLFLLRQQTTLIAWLNLMPEHRWVGSSAEIIANLVQMYQMDTDGFGKAIDIIRGQPLHHYLSPFL